MKHSGTSSVCRSFFRSHLLVALLAASLIAAAVFAFAQAPQSAQRKGPPPSPLDFSVRLVVDPPPAPAQPVPFSHKIHAGDLDISCRECHLNPDPGTKMGNPGAASCMTCHRAIQRDQPAIRRLAAIAQQGTDIPWVPVYQLPDYVFFSHRAHSEAGARCIQCHGRVALHDALFQEADISMAACVNCHARNKASVDCQYCHAAMEPASTTASPPTPR